MESVGENTSPFFEIEIVITILRVDHAVTAQLNRIYLIISKIDS